MSLTNQRVTAMVSLCIPEGRTAKQQADFLRKQFQFYWPYFHPIVEIVGGGVEGGPATPPDALTEDDILGTPPANEAQTTAILKQAHARQATMVATPKAPAKGAEPAESMEPLSDTERRRLRRAARKERKALAAGEAPAVDLPGAELL